MDKTPVGKCRSSNRRIPSCLNDVMRRKNDITNKQPMVSSPIIDNLESENDDSFSQIASTQEGCDSIDVVWDWNSPQPKQRPRKSKRQLPQSPKIPMKRHPSNHSMQDFEKLREELRLLRDEIARPDDEELLLLSPVEEAEYKSIHQDDAYLNSIEQHNFVSHPQPLTQETLFNDDLFDDSIDDQLVQFSQMVESDLISSSSSNPSARNDNNVKLRNPPPINPNDSRQVNQKNILRDFQRTLDDSFDVIMKDMEIGNKLKNASNNSSAVKTVSGKVEFHRTKSFELSSLDSYSGKMDKTKLNEIERKRQEALAKLESKKKHGLKTNSPIQCSFEVIEQKRLQALAKREAKRQQEIIEQKRQEAVRRLEMNRKKNASVIKSSLSNRLN